MPFKNIEAWLRIYKTLPPNELENFGKYIRQDADLLGEFNDLLNNIADPAASELADPVFHQLFNFYRSNMTEIKHFCIELLPIIVDTYLVSYYTAPHNLPACIGAFILGIYNLTATGDISFLRKDALSLSKPSIYHDPPPISLTINKYGNNNNHSYYNYNNNNNNSFNNYNINNNNNNNSFNVEYKRFESINAYNRSEVVSYVLGVYNWHICLMSLESQKALCVLCSRLSRIGFKGLMDLPTPTHQNNNNNSNKKHVINTNSNNNHSYNNNNDDHGHDDVDNRSHNKDINETSQATSKSYTKLSTQQANLSSNYLSSTHSSTHLYNNPSPQHPSKHSSSHPSTYLSAHSCQSSNLETHHPHNQPSSHPSNQPSNQQPKNQPSNQHSNHQPKNQTNQQSNNPSTNNPSSHSSKHPKIQKQTSTKIPLLSDLNISKIDESTIDQIKIPFTAPLFLELLKGIYFLIFNGLSDLGVRSLEHCHLRASYEMNAQVLLVTNAMLNSMQPLATTTTSSRQQNNRHYHHLIPLSPSLSLPSVISLSKDAITSASFKTKKLPEDIEVQDNKGHSHMFQLEQQMINASSSTSDNLDLSATSAPNHESTPDSDKNPFSRIAIISMIKNKEKSFRHMQQRNKDGSKDGGKEGGKDGSKEGKEAAKESKDGGGGGGDISSLFHGLAQKKTSLSTKSNSDYSMLHFKFNQQNVDANQEAFPEANQSYTDDSDDPKSSSTLPDVAFKSRFIKSLQFNFDKNRFHSNKANNTANNNSTSNNANKNVMTSNNTNNDDDVSNGYKLTDWSKEARSNFDWTMDEENDEDDDEDEEDGDNDRHKATQL